MNEHFPKPLCLGSTLLKGLCSEEGRGFWGWCSLWNPKDHRKTQAGCSMSTAPPASAGPRSSATGEWLGPPALGYLRGLSPGLGTLLARHRAVPVEPREDLSRAARLSLRPTALRISCIPLTSLPHLLPATQANIS